MFDNIPDEIILFFIDYIELKDFARLAITSKRFQALIYTYPLTCKLGRDVISRNSYSNMLTYFDYNKKLDKNYIQCKATREEYQQSIMNCYIDKDDPEDKSLQIFNLVPFVLSTLVSKPEIIPKFLIMGTILSAGLQLVTARFLNDAKAAEEDLKKAADDLSNKYVISKNHRKR